MTAAEVGNKAGRGWVETLLLVVSGADEREGMSCGTSRSWQEEGRWLEESAWIGHCTRMEEWEIMVCEQERQDQEAAVGSTRADTRGHEAQGFPSRECVSWSGCGHKEEAKRVFSWQYTDPRTLGSF